MPPASSISAAVALASRSQQAWSLSLALRSHAEALAATDPARSADALDELRRATQIQAEQDLVCDVAWTALAAARVLTAAGDIAAAGHEAARARDIFEKAGMRRAMDLPGPELSDRAA